MDTTLADFIRKYGAEAFAALGALATGFDCETTLGSVTPIAYIAIGD